MNRKHLDFTVWKKHALQNPKVYAEYVRMQPTFSVIREVIQARIKIGVTQKELAQKIGTKQSVISRLESGRANPSIEFLNKLAHALNSYLQVKIIPR